MSNKSKIKRALERYRKSNEKSSKSLYYEDYFHSIDLRKAGIVQCDQKSHFDLVSLDGTPESIHLFGFSRDELGSHFELTLTVVPLNRNRSLLSSETGTKSRWSLARANFSVFLVSEDETNSRQATRYTYEHEQLLDYEEKRRDPGKHENRNIYRVGCLSIETVLPYSLTRILFNGTARVESLSRQDGNHWKPVDNVEAHTNSSDLKFMPVKVAISTHPTCDKFYYPQRFDVDYHSELIDKSLSEGLSNRRAKDYREFVGDITCDDRLEQPLMFQGTVESLLIEQKQVETKPSSETTGAFIMWGAKVKQRGAVALKLPRECLFAWSECGQQIHLSRTAGRDRTLLNGMVHSSYDYASPICDAKLCRRAEAGELVPIESNWISSFSELTSEHAIKVRAYKVKEFTLEFQEDARPLSDSMPMRIKINGFDGWARLERLDSGDQLRDANLRSWILNLHDELYTPRLAQEALLGGKGHSLVQLVQMVRSKSLSSLVAAAATSSTTQRRLSVPQGLVVTSEAYEYWCRAQGDELAHTLRVLDARRLELAAKSALNQDPLSSEHVAASEAQRRLAGLCESTRAQLLKYPLPELLQEQLRRELEILFGQPQPDGHWLHTRGKRRLFAVRSSCVGEDSLETSAAGQMRTILDASSFASICAAVVECWASQFELEALTYKSQNGLAFNLPMAVVVQELVECHSAGVAATCDPLTGNLTRLEITANLGQGENVVAGKRTDTMRISLERLTATSWNETRDEFELVDSSRLDSNNCDIEKLPGAVGEGEQVCLSDEQILSLGNLLLALRHQSGPLRQREVEWGITQADDDDPGQFHVHLLQSRPLTHLARLSTREIDHELDSGLPCALDHVSRANLGEVMPGAMCPLNSSWFFPITAVMTSKKPYEPMHSRQIYVGDNFAHYARMIMMIVTYGDAIKRFGAQRAPGKPADPDEDTTARDVIYSMIGSTFEEPKDEAELAVRERFLAEKVNPLAPDEHRGIVFVLATDALHGLHMLRAKRALESSVLTQDLTPIDRLAAKQVAAETTTTPQEFRVNLNEQINKLYGRLLTRANSIMLTWLAHILATLTNMTLNAMVLKLMADQPAYKDKSMIATEVLNDFSVLMRGQPEVAGSSKSRRRKTTESGDISKLIQELLDCFAEEKRIEHMQTLSLRELYGFLNDPTNVKKLQSCKLYARFLHKNGHRAYKEFDLATHSWSDDQSYIVRLLATRLKGYSHDLAKQAREKRLESERLQAEKLVELAAKFTSNKLVLTKFAIPRARNAAIRREGTKSLLIKSVHKYRLAFRHLGGLLCLAGLLPSADLIFYLTMEEIDEIIRRCCVSGDSELADRCARADVMPRLLYKARRRQQRTRAYDRVNFPRPTMPVDEMLQTIREQTEQQVVKPPQVAANGSTAMDQQANGAGGENGQSRVQVTGITSCAGCVTGRACVISSLDELDEQLQSGDILITYSIDISWSVYFYQLAGIVTEVGGIVSHGAVVAREYGLPTLCTAVGACTKFRTGQLVTLDAGTGVCYLAANDNQDKDCCAT